MRGVGRREQRVEITGGLRSVPLVVLALSDLDAVVADTPITSRTTFLALNLEDTKLPYSQTLCATVTQSSPAIGAIRLMVEGYDEDGEFVSEISPLLPVIDKTTTHIYLACTFAYVVRVAYLGTFSAGSTMSVGWGNDLKKADTATVAHIAGNNQGWATGRNLSPRHAAEQVLSAVAHSLTTDASWGGRDIIRIAHAEAGFTGPIDKWSLDWSKLVQLNTGNVPVYSPTDAVFVTVDLISYELRA
jgi:hypothetical protein